MCSECEKNSAIYVRSCANCWARYISTLPTKESQQSTAESAAKKYGHDAASLLSAAKQIRRTNLFPVANR